MAEMTVLNPTLYERVQLRLGAVKVCEAGLHRCNLFGTDLAVWEVIAPQVVGETYFVACPFCNCDGLTLAVHHGYGCLDCVTKKQKPYLAHCFGGNCLSSDDNRH